MNRKKPNFVPAEANSLHPLSPARRWSGWVTAAGKVLFIFEMLLSWSPGAWDTRQITHPKGPLYGIYDVEKFVESGRERPALATESNRWSRVSLVDLADTASGSVVIRNSDDSMLHYQSVVARDSARLSWSEMPFYSDSNKHPRETARGTELEH